MLGFGVRITKIKITWSAQDKIESGNETDALKIITWLFDHARAKNLDLLGCYVKKSIIGRIANLVRLKVLDLRHCDWEECDVKRGVA